MPPKQKILKEQIISTAMEIALENGIKAINIRNIAKKLNCSIAPIYVNFESVNDLIIEVGIKIQKIMESFMTVQYCKFPVVNLGVGILLFASRYKALYRELVFNRVFIEDESVYIHMMKKDPLLQGLNERDIAVILNKLSVITTGLSIEAACEESSKDIHELLELLFEMGMDIINFTRTEKKLQKAGKFFDKSFVKRIIEEYLSD